MPFLRAEAVHTDHILFVAAGAFHAVRLELAPELQRFPCVELSALGEEEHAAF